MKNHQPRPSPAGFEATPNEVPRTSSSALPLGEPGGRPWDTRWVACGSRSVSWVEITHVVDLQIGLNGHKERVIVMMVVGFYEEIVWNPDTQLGGGFKYLLFPSLPREDSQFDSYFSDELKPPTSCRFF